MFSKVDKVNVEKLRKTPVVPYEGMKFPSDCFFPYQLRKGWYHVHLHFICAKVRKCMPLRSAFASQNLGKYTYEGWVRKYKEEKELYEGTEYTTPIIMFFDAIHEAEAENEAEIVDVLLSTAIEDRNTDSAKYLLDKRYKWKETKAVEMDTVDDKSIEINITPMEDGYEEKPNDEGE